jgi:hypothetical protein
MSELPCFHEHGKLQRFGSCDLLIFFTNLWWEGGTSSCDGQGLQRSGFNSPLK